MATIIPTRSGTNGTAQSTSNNLNRQTSLSSFPSSRTPSMTSVRNGIPVVYSRSQRGGSNSSSQGPSTPPSANTTTSVPQTVRRRRLRPQYPADSSERHVEYILVASFHVDRGPIMEHQYPAAISGDENMLAELMLPDQAHVRSEDWTVFFLHKDSSDEEEAAEERRRARKARRERREANTGTAAKEERKGRKDESAISDSEYADGEMDEDEDQEEDEEEGGEGPPLIYVLNLVNTKQDTSARRWLNSSHSRRICTDHGTIEVQL